MVLLIELGDDLLDGGVLHEEVADGVAGGDPRDEGGGGHPGGIEAEVNAVSILPLDPGVRVRLGFRGANHWFERLEYMNEASECFTLCVGISQGGCRSERCDYGPSNKKLGDSHRSLSGVAHGVHGGIPDKMGLSKRQSPTCVVFLPTMLVKRKTCLVL